MTSEQKKVEEFMRAFGQEVNRFPLMPSIKVRKLRAKLILEEALETAIALGISSVETPDSHALKLKDILEMVRHNRSELNESEDPITLTDIADGLADLHYVAYCGTGAACGIDMAGVFNRVHRSNMTKLWTHADITSEHFNPAYSKTQTQGGMWLVKDRDGKVIKSPSYTPADIQL